MKLKARILVGMLFALVLFAALARGAATSAAHPAAAKTPTIGISGIENSTGAFDLSLENSRDSWEVSNGSIVLNIDTNRHVNGLNLTLTDFTASESMWWGGWNVVSGATQADVSNDTIKGRAQQIVPPGRFEIDEAWLYMAREENGGSGFQELLVQVANDSSDLPGTVIANFSSNITAFSTSPMWHSFVYNSPSNTSTAFWIVLNGSALFDDRIKWRMKDGNPQASGMEAREFEGSWVVQADWDGLAMVRGKRLNTAGTAPWVGDPLALACNVSADGGAFRSISSTIMLNSSAVRDGNVVLSFQGNISASTGVSYTWLFTRANETEPTEAEEKAPESIPFVDRFLTAHGWHAVVLVVVLAITAILAIILWKKTGPWVIAIGLGVLATYFAFLVFFPVVVQPMATFYSDSWYVVGSHYNSSTELTRNWWDSGVDRLNNAGMGLNRLLNDSFNAHNAYWANQGELLENSSVFWWSSWGDFVDSAVEMFLDIPESVGGWSLWAVLGGGTIIFLAVALWRGLSPKWTVIIGLCAAAALIGLALAFPSLTLVGVVVI